MSTQIKCPECGAYKGHAFNCSLIDLEEAKTQLLRYREAWHKLYTADNDWRKKVAASADFRSRQAKELATLWQGKCAILRHENNQLRKKLHSVPKS